MARACLSPAAHVYGFLVVCNVLLSLGLARVLSLRFIALEAGRFKFHVFVLRLAFVPVFFNMADKKRRRTDSVVDVEPRASELEDIAKLRFSGKAVREAKTREPDKQEPDIAHQTGKP